MSLELEVNEQIKDAMKAKDSASLRGLRAIKAAILLAKTEASNVELDAAAELKIIQKLLKQRKDSLIIFEEQNRADLATTEKEEIDVLMRFMPEMLSEDDVRAEIQGIIDSSGAAGPQDMGKVMGPAMGKLGSKSDGQTISRIVKELLS